MDKFKGIFTALLTPFHKDGSINEKSLEQLIEMNIQKGVKGFYVNGSTAEVFLLTEEERNHIYQLVSEINRGRCTLIAHIGSISTLQAIEYGHTTEKYGYDAVSSVAPFYYKFNFEEIKQHYYMIADHVNLPIVIYNFPNFSGVTLTPANISEFLRDDRFIGVKHTSNDYFAMEQFKAMFPDKVIYNGFDEMFLAGLSMGADGGIGSTYNFMAEKFVRMQQLYKEGRMQDALAVQKDVNTIVAALCKVGVGQGEKAVLSLMGIDFGEARPPFKTLEKKDYDFLEKTVLPLL